MIRMMLLIGSFAITISFATVSRAQDDDGGTNNNVDLSPHYTPHEQTDEERLQTFQAPPPPPHQDSVVDQVVHTYNNLPVQPGYNAQMHAPTLNYNKHF